MASKLPREHHYRTENLLVRGGRTLLTYMAISLDFGD